MIAPSTSPGPWRVVLDATHKGNRRIAGRAFEAIAKVYADEPVEDDAKAVSNSAAIAAVPDLLEAGKPLAERAAHYDADAHDQQLSDEYRVPVRLGDLRAMCAAIRKAGAL